MEAEREFKIKIETLESELENVKRQYAQLQTEYDKAGELAKKEHEQRQDLDKQLQEKTEQVTQLETQIHQQNLVLDEMQEELIKWLVSSDIMIRIYVRLIVAF